MKWEIQASKEILADLRGPMREQETRSVHILPERTHKCATTADLRKLQLLETKLVLVEQRERMEVVEKNAFQEIPRVARLPFCQRRQELPKRDPQ